MMSKINVSEHPHLNKLWNVISDLEIGSRRAHKGTENSLFDCQGRLINKDDDANVVPSKGTRPAATQTEPAYVYDGWTEPDRAEMVNAARLSAGLEGFLVIYDYIFEKLH